MSGYDHEKVLRDATRVIRSADEEGRRVERNALVQSLSKKMRAPEAPPSPSLPVNELIAVARANGKKLDLILEALRAMSPKPAAARVLSSEVKATRGVTRPRP